jgi:hypothetical protein
MRLLVMWRAKPNNIKRRVVIRVMRFGFTSTYKAWQRDYIPSLHGHPKKYLGSSSFWMLRPPLCLHSVAKFFAVWHRSSLPVVLAVMVYALKAALFHVELGARFAFPQSPITHCRVLIKLVNRLLDIAFKASLLPEHLK